MERRFGYSRKLTAGEARRAIYLDFESHKKGAPFLVGRLLGPDDFQLTVLDPTLYPAADGSPLLKAQNGELHRYMQGLLNLCATEQRRLIAFSEREIEVIAEFAPDLLDATAARYGNALPLVRRWFRAEHPDLYDDLKTRALQNKSRVGLKDYLSTDAVPCDHIRQLKGKFSPSKAATVVREQLLKKDGDYSLVSSGGKRKWTNLLKYNRADCESLRCLVLYVLSGQSQKTA